MDPSDTDLRYYEQFGPVEGMLAPRAAFSSDAPSIDLCGVWRFRLSPTVAEAPTGMWTPDFDDSGWAEPAAGRVRPPTPLGTPQIWYPKR